MSQRDKFVKVRFSDSELERAKGLAPYQLSTYMRELVLQENKQSNKTTVVEQVADPKLIRHLAMIGNNLNQLARIANSEKSNLVNQKILLELSAIREQLERYENAS